MDGLAELRARQQEIEQEWQWLHDALNTVARARAEQGDAAAFRLMQGQAMRVGQRRVELDVRIAELERSRLHSGHDPDCPSLPEMRAPQHRHLSR